MMLQIKNFVLLNLLVTIAIFSLIVSPANAISDILIDLDGINSALQGGPEFLEVRNGDPLTQWPTDAPPLGARAGIDWLDIDGNMDWSLDDDLMSEDPDMCPTSIRNAMYDPDRDCLILDLNGHLNSTMGLVVDCDLETGISPSGKLANPCPDPRLTFFDSNGNTFWDDGEDIVLDLDEDGVFDKEQNGIIRIVKEKLDEEDPDAMFSFKSNITDFENFELFTGTMTELNVTVGIYFIIETEDQPMWSLHSAKCSDGSPINSINVTSDELVTCTFVNDFERNESLVGGEYLIIDTNPLLLAGIKTSLAWIIPTIAGIFGAGFYLAIHGREKY